MQPAQKYRYNSKIYTVEKGNKERESERTEIDVTRNQKKKKKPNTKDTGPVLYIGYINLQVLAKRCCLAVNMSKNNMYKEEKYQTGKGKSK